MATKLTSERVIQREIPENVLTDRGEKVVFRLLPTGILLKQAGQRWASAVVLPWGGVWSAACKFAAAEAATAAKRAVKVRRGAL